MPHYIVTHGASGPIIDIWVGLSSPLATVLTAQKKPVPEPVLVNALVDTGASHTMLDKSIVDRLGLLPRGLVPAVTASTGAKAVLVPTFDVSLNIPLGSTTTSAWSREAWEVSCTTLLHQGFAVLLGRDILSHALLVYDGQHGTVTMSF